MKIMWLGTYERDYPRARVLDRRAAGARRRGRRAPPAGLGARAPQGRRVPAARPAGADAGGRFAGAWGALAVEGAREPGVQAIVAGYPAQPDALPAWCVARARRVPLVVDMMISLADTLGGDRGRRRPRSPPPRWRAWTAPRCPPPTWWSPTPPPAPTGSPSASGCRAPGSPSCRWAPSRRASAPARRRTALRAPSSTASSPRSTASPRCSRRRGGPGRRRCG